MPKPPLITIIVPTYNRAGYLLQTINSILTQTYSNIELLIVSDNSTDDTVALLKTIEDERLHFFQLPQKTNGPGTVRNFGIAKAKGDLIAFCDDDDIWLPQKLAMQVYAFNQHPQTQVMGCLANFINDENAITQSSFSSLLKQKITAIAAVNKKYLLPFFNCFILSSVIVKSNFFREMGAFSEVDFYQGHEDFDLWLRTCNKINMYILPQKLIQYRIHTTQITMPATKQQYKKDAFVILKKHLPHFNPLQKLLYAIRLLVFKTLGF